MKDPGTLTPRQIDERLADWYGERATHLEWHNTARNQVHKLAGDNRDRFGIWDTDDATATAIATKTKDDPEVHLHLRLNAADLLVTYYKTLAEIRRLDDLTAPYEAEFRRRPWSRFYQLASTTHAHIHSHTACQGLHRSDLGDLRWHPALSGKSEEEAVAELGPTLCSKCFPSAPVEWRRDPADLNADPDQCEAVGTRPADDTVKHDQRANNWRGGYYTTCPACGKRGVTVRQGDWTIGKHKRQVKPVYEISGPGGGPLNIGNDTIKTVRTAQIRYTDDAAYVVACDNGYPARGRYEKASEDAETVLAALAAAKGVTRDEMAVELVPKVLKKARQYFAEGTEISMKGV